ncbi:Nucleobindin-2 [Clonorchis sinensis]|uniref:Nucleobindin-2 n=1 Tax=Clonorchis sinensis TaxID=79923 RepID=A0A8T1MDK1_CLOSI|nr:Nucleobindin-2 [Clonorchis sinensis]
MLPRSSVVILLLIFHALGVPVVPKKKPSEEVLKKELGEADFQELHRQLASERLEMVKKYVHMKPEERDEYAKQLKEEFLKRSQHETVYEPGSRPQLQEVWRDEDLMDDDSYSPNMLFKKHDLNNDQFLDSHEINALIEHEIEKIYPANETGHEPLRNMEMRRMRSALLERMDHNHDGRVSLAEFLSPMQDYDDDDEWTPLEDLQDAPDFEKKTDDKYVLDYAKQQLELHPEDHDLEEAMHVLNGMKGIPDPSHNPPDSAKSYFDMKPSSGGGAAAVQNPPPAAAVTAPNADQTPQKPS